MKKYKNFVGIDVSKLSLDVAILNVGQPNKFKHQKVENCNKAIKAFLKKLPEDTLVCFEHTGNYDLNLCYQLADTSIDFWVENPLLIHRYKGFNRGKTDKTDAKDIAEYAMVHQHKAKLYKLQEDDLAEINLLQNQREKLVKFITSLKQTNESISNYPKKVKRSIAKLNKRQIKLLECEKKKVEQKIKKVLKANEKLNQKFELAKSVVGIGDQTALGLLLVTKGFTSFKNWRKLACYIGTAPFQYSSGTSIKGKAKVSHYADKKTKALINMAAIAAKRFDAEIKQYYEKKLAEGKHKMLVINNIRNKLLARVFAVVKRGTPFANTKQYHTL